MTEFEDDLPAGEPDLDELASVGDQLRTSRPVIRASVRGDIRRGLERRGRVVRPRRFWRIVVSTTAAGVACLALAAAGLAHVGPWVPQTATTSASMAPQTSANAAASSSVRGTRPAAGHRIRRPSSLPLVD